ncbi:MAG: ribbon-helix-helix protein, CopG family [Solirubrobacteraceae bacterium]
MELERYADDLREQLASAAEAGGVEARALAERLLAPLDSAVRLMLLTALSDAAAEIASELAPGSVELRLRAGAPEFVVVAPPRDAVSDPESAPPSTLAEGELTRLNLRLPEQLKRRVEQAADREGLSTNAWLVRAAASAVERDEPGARARASTPRGGQHFTGWGR